MLADRQYMRRAEAPRAMSITVVLLTLNIVVFFLEYANGARSRNLFMEYGALSLDGLKRGFIWQFITFQFLHGGLPHLVLNSLGLYFFGRPLEGELGRREFLKLYLFSGVLGGVLQALLGLTVPRFGGPMVGASAGICGLVAAFALLAPESSADFHPDIRGPCRPSRRNPRRNRLPQAVLCHGPASVQLGSSASKLASTRACQSPLIPTPVLAKGKLQAH